MTVSALYCLGSGERGDCSLHSGLGCWSFRVISPSPSSSQQILGLTFLLRGLAGSSSKCRGNLSHNAFTVSGLVRLEIFRKTLRKQPCRVSRHTPCPAPAGCSKLCSHISTSTLWNIWCDWLRHFFVPLLHLTLYHKMNDRNVCVFSKHARMPDTLRHRWKQSLFCLLVVALPDLPGSMGIMLHEYKKASLMA